MRILLLIASLLATVPALPAIAGPDRVSLLAGSHHIAARYPFEEINPGFFLTWERPHVDWSVGVFRNSFGKPAVAATAALPIVRSRRGSIDLFAGLALYPGDGRYFAVHLGDVVPIGGLQFRYRNFFAQVIPSDGKATAAIVSFGLTFTLN